MIYQHLFSQANGGRVVRAGLIGSGHFGTAVITQSRAIPSLEIPVIADQNLDAARRAYRQAGVSGEDIVTCDNRRSVMAAMEAGKSVIVADANLLMDLPIDVVVESTGVPEAGAHHAHEAIRHGKHVAMITKETDSVVGPILKRQADRAGVIYTPVDGDQHGLLIGLVAWVRTLGLTVVSGGKARDGEFVYDLSAKTVTAGRRTVTVDERHVWALQPISDGQASRYVQARRDLLAELPQAAGYDLCEMVIAANATGLRPDVPPLHAPVVRTCEIPAVLCPQAEGGILQTTGAIEVVTSFRRKDEAGLGGGVFVTVSCENDYSRMILTTKGLIANRSDSTALIYRPYHLCGVETPMSILCAGLLNIPTGSAEIEPLVDLVAETRHDLKTGTVLGNDHSPDLRALILPAKPLADGTPMPLHLMNGRRLKKDVSAGTLIALDMVERPEDSALWSLRRQQDAHFFKRAQ